MRLLLALKYTALTLALVWVLTLNEQIDYAVVDLTNMIVNYLDFVYIMLYLVYLLSAQIILPLVTVPLSLFRFLTYIPWVLSTLVLSAMYACHLTMVWYDKEIYVSFMVHWLKRQPRLLPELVRTTFNSLSMTDVKEAVDHTHGLSAADRSAGTSFAERLANNLGLEAYYFQRSRSDERHGRLGSRSYYWAKDLTTHPAIFRTKPNSLLVMIDVDYYVDMPNFLLQNVKPVLLYTFQPTQVSKATEEFSYTFVDDVAKYMVTGGASYEHKVWNYSKDNLIVRKYFHGIVVKTAVYLVDRMSTSADHEVVMLTPVGSWGIAGSQYCLSLNGSSLERYQLQHEGFNRMMTMSKAGGLRVSTGLPGQVACANVPKAVDDTIATIAKASRYDLSMATVLGYVNEDKAQAAVLVAYHRMKNANLPMLTCPVELAVRRYQYKPHRYDPEAKSSMVAFMTPIVDGAFVPDKCRGNDEQMVEGRIKKFQPRELVMTPFIASIMREFLEKMIPAHQVHTRSPAEVDVVMDRQNRPSQRAILEQSMFATAKRKLQVFMKAESYGKVSDPRPISTINSVDKREYSRVIYGFEDLVKQHPWYAFSHTPKEIAERVAEICTKAKHVVNTDFSRYDGHVSNILRELERMALVRAFREEHHPKVLELHRSQYKLRATTTEGVSYNSETARASGSPETSCFNTMDNAFIAYLGLRSTFVNGQAMDPEQAWESLGVYGGDDGLTADVDEISYKKSAQSVGQDLTAERIPRYSAGVKFLARMYSPDVWNGSPDSCCDVKRTLSKLHVTVRLQSNITPLDKLTEKLFSLGLSDWNTPIIRDLVRNFERLAPITNVDFINGHNTTSKLDLRQMYSWNQRYSSAEQYPNENSGDWMEDLVERCLPDFDYNGFNQWCMDAKRAEDFLSMPMFCPRPDATSSVPAVVDSGETVVCGLDHKHNADGCVHAKGNGSVNNDGHNEVKDTHSIESKDPNVKPQPETTSVVQVKPKKTKKFKGKPKESFEEMKVRKIADGTWKDKTKRSELTGKSYEAVKKRKMVRKKWEVVAPRSGKTG
jgi:hypothetical protein